LRNTANGVLSFQDKHRAELEGIIKAFETLYGESALCVRYGHFQDVDGQPVDISYEREVVIRRNQAVINLGYEGQAVLTLDSLVRVDSEFVLSSKR
jgi:hypothetical protein